MKINYSKRIKKIPPYLFAELDIAKKKVLASGKRVFDFGVGDPDLPTFESVLASVKKHINDPATHKYPSYIGSETYRQAAADYISKRFQVEIDPANEVISLIGSKEGIAHFPLAFVDPGDKVFIPEPGYPVYRDGTIFAGGEVILMPLTMENSFLPDVAAAIKKHGVPKIVWVNYPNNPTGVSCTREFYIDLVALAHEYGFIIASDAAYTEIYRPGSIKPLSIMSIPGAKDVAIEFYSLSKMFNMTGWRVGFAIGNSEIISGLAKIKKSIDSGVFDAIQFAVADSIGLGIEQLEKLRDIYFSRRAQVESIIPSLELEAIASDSTFYIWCRILDGKSSEQKASELLQGKGILVSPGTGFGPSGEGYVRFSLTCPQKDIDDFSALFG